MWNQTGRLFPCSQHGTNSQRQLKREATLAWNCSWDKRSAVLSQFRPEPTELYLYCLSQMSPLCMDVSFGSDLAALTVSGLALGLYSLWILVGLISLAAEPILSWLSTSHLHKQSYLKLGSQLRLVNSRSLYQLSLTIIWGILIPWASHWQSGGLAITEQVAWSAGLLFLGQVFSLLPHKVQIPSVPVGCWVASPVVLNWDTVQLRIMALCSRRQGIQKESLVVSLLLFERRALFLHTHSWLGEIRQSWE